MVRGAMRVMLGLFALGCDDGADAARADLDAAVRWFDENLSVEDFRHYQEHVGKSVAIANRMQLSEGALLAIAQHHELMDGSGLRSSDPPSGASIGAICGRATNPPAGTQPRLTAMTWTR